MYAKTISETINKPVSIDERVSRRVNEMDMQRISLVRSLNVFKPLDGLVKEKEAE
ncbi:hypothetical protein GCM10028806_00390 [Spirosoma terrae]